MWLFQSWVGPDFGALQETKSMPANILAMDDHAPIAHEVTCRFLTEAHIRCNILACRDHG